MIGIQKHARKARKVCSVTPYLVNIVMNLTTKDNMDIRANRVGNGMQVMSKYLHFYKRKEGR